MLVDDGYKVLCYLWGKGTDQHQQTTMAVDSELAGLVGAAAAAPVLLVPNEGPEGDTKLW